MNTPDKFEADRFLQIIQIDGIGLLPKSENKVYMCTIVDTWSGRGFSYPGRKDDKKSTIRTLES